MLLLTKNPFIQKEISHINKQKKKRNGKIY